jgi:hypothetical protein
MQQQNCCAADVSDVVLHHRSRKQYPIEKLKKSNPKEPAGKQQNIRTKSNP